MINICTRTEKVTGGYVIMPTTFSKMYYVKNKRFEVQNVRLILKRIIFILLFIHLKSNDYFSMKYQPFNPYPVGVFSTILEFLFTVVSESPRVI